MSGSLVVPKNYDISNWPVVYTLQGLNVYGKWRQLLVAIWSYLCESLTWKCWRVGTLIFSPRDWFLVQANSLRAKSELMTLNWTCSLLLVCVLSISERNWIDPPYSNFYTCNLPFLLFRFLSHVYSSRKIGSKVVHGLALLSNVARLVCSHVPIQPTVCTWCIMSGVG